MTDAPLFMGHGRPQKWRCDGCDRLDYWSDSHMVYGSLKDEEDGKWDRVIVTCSDGCRARLIADERIPAPTEKELKAMNLA